MTAVIAIGLVIFAVASLSVWVWDIAEVRKNRAVLSRLLDLAKEQRQDRLRVLNDPDALTALSEVRL